MIMIQEMQHIENQKFEESIFKNFSKINENTSFIEKTHLKQNQIFTALSKAIEDIANLGETKAEVSDFNDLL